MPPERRIRVIANPTTPAELSSHWQRDHAGLVLIGSEPPSPVARAYEVFVREHLKAHGHGSDEAALESGTMTPAGENPHVHPLPLGGRSQAKEH